MELSPSFVKTHTCIRTPKKYVCSDIEHYRVHRTFLNSLLALSENSCAYALAPTSKLVAVMQFGLLVVWLLPVIQNLALSTPTRLQEQKKSSRPPDPVMVNHRNALERRSSSAQHSNDDTRKREYDDLLEYFRRLEKSKSYNVDLDDRLRSRVYIISVRHRYQNLWAQPVFPPGQEDEAEAFRSCQAVMVSFPFTFPTTTAAGQNDNIDYCGHTREISFQSTAILLLGGGRS